MKKQGKRTEQRGGDQISFTGRECPERQEAMRLIEVNVRDDGVTISGHAGYAAFGYDIVCAGATALAQTLIKSVEDLTEDEIKYDISPGWVDIKYGNLSEKSKTLVDSFFIGIQLIVNEFPENIRIV